MPGVAARYQVRLLNTSGTQVAVFDTWSSLEFSRKVNDVGSYELSFYDNGDSRFDYFTTDSFVEIYRAVPSAGLEWYKEFSGFHRKTERRIDEDGRKIFVSSGYDINHLLARRGIAYRHGTTRAEKDDYVEDVMKEYVDENAGPTAVASDRVRAGNFTGFTVEAVSGSHTQTANWRGDRAFKNLLDVLKELAIYSQSTTPTSKAVDFAVVKTGGATFEFRTYLDQLGTDRSSTSSSPLTFSVEYENLKNSLYSTDRLSEGNAIIVLGKGELSTQDVISVEDATAIAVSPWNDSEVIRPSDKNEFEYQLEDYGEAVLEELSAKENFTGTPIQTKGTLYGLHYFLGDKVQLRQGDISEDKKVLHVVVSVTAPDGERLDVRFGDY